MIDILGKYSFCNIPIKIIIINYNKINDNTDDDHNDDDNEL